MEVNKTTIDNNQEEIRLRLDDYLEFDELISPTEFANTVGIDPSGFIKMLKGQMKITLATLKKISDATEGVPYYDEDFLLGFDEIGTPSSENPDFLIRMPGYEKATLWCNASGHSMEPEINNGDIIALQRVEDFSFLPFGDVYGFITTNGMRTIKRLGRASREGYYRLIPTNKEYDEQEIPINKIALVYRVMGTMKSF